MKNGLLKSFVGLFVALNIVFFENIVAGFLIASDVLWAFCNFDLMCVILGCLFGILFLVFIVYFIKHREREQLVTTVEFKSPNDMTPLEIGFLVDGIVDSEDLSSLLVYWASKKYIEISKDGKQQKVKKLVEKLPDGARDYEKKMFAVIFGNDKEVTTNQISERINGNQVVADAINTVEKDVGGKYFDTKALWHRQIFVCFFAFLFYFSVMYFRLEYFVDVVPIIEGFAIVSTALFVLVADWFLRYYDYRHKNNSKRGKRWSLVCLVSLFAVMIGLSCWFFWTDIYQVFFLCAVIVLMFLTCFLSRKIQIYKKEGIAKLGQVIGFKEFIEVTEKDRIKMLVEENPNVFYEVLPYAFVLGVSDKWIKDLKVIKADLPNAVDDKDLKTVAIWSTFYSNSHINFAVAMRVATASKLAGTIAMGANGGKGGSKGGSNFGGFRRR